MSAIQERPRFETTAQPGLDPFINFMESSARRDALIDRVVTFDPAGPKGATSEIPVLNDEVLEAARLFKSNITDIAPSEPVDIFSQTQSRNTINGFEQAIPDSTVQTQRSFKDRLRLKISSLKDTIIHSTPAKIARRATLAAVLASGSSAPALANGFKIEPGAINTTAECVTDDPNAENLLTEDPNDTLPFIVYTSDPDYAQKIVTGEVLIALGGEPVAAVGGEGDKTAAADPITPDEAFANLAIPAPACPPKEPDPTPEPTGTPKVEPTPKPKNVEDLIKAKRTGANEHKIQADFKKVYDPNGPYAEKIDSTLTSEGANSLFEGCKSGKELSWCRTLAEIFYEQYLKTGEMIFYNTAVDLYNFAIKYAVYKDKKIVDQGRVEEWKKDLNSQLRRRFPSPDRTN